MVKYITWSIDSRVLAKSGSYCFEEFEESTSFRALHKNNLGIHYGTKTSIKY